MSQPDLCPRCGGRDVLHFWYGYPAEWPPTSDQPWERHRGCLIRPYDRECQACALRWPSGLPAELSAYALHGRLDSVPAVLRYVAEIHAEQHDKAGQPYVGHLMRIWHGVWDPWPYHSTYAEMAALLHDAVEDQPVTLAGLRALGVPDEVVRLVDLLTRRDDVSAEEYYARIAAEPTARRIKLVDIADNSDPRRLSQLPGEEAERLSRKYDDARCLLGVDFV